MGSFVVMIERAMQAGISGTQDDAASLASVSSPALVLAPEGPGTCLQPPGVVTPPVGWDNSI
jgi:hypothetical protein